MDIAYAGFVGINFFNPSRVSDEEFSQENNREAKVSARDGAGIL
jgi:hypothetical protein